jgi:hypothetical protein
MTTEQRLERLERENRWMRRIGVVAVAVAAAVFLVGQGKRKKLPDLEVRSLTIMDQWGRPRIFLHATRGSRGSPELSFCGHDGKRRVVLHGGEDASGLSLHNQDGKRRAVLATAEDRECHLALLTKDGKPGAVLELSELGFTGRSRVLPAMAGLTLWDPKGNIIWQVPKK